MLSVRSKRTADDRFCAHACPLRAATPIPSIPHLTRFSRSSLWCDTGILLLTRRYRLVRDRALDVHEPQAKFTVNCITVGVYFFWPDFSHQQFTPARMITRYEREVKISSHALPTSAGLEDGAEKHTSRSKFLDKVHSSVDSVYPILYQHASIITTSCSRRVKLLSYPRLNANAIWIIVPSTMIDCVYAPFVEADDPVAKRLQQPNSTAREGEGRRISIPIHLQQIIFLARLGYVMYKNHNRDASYALDLKSLRVHRRPSPVHARTSPTQRRPKKLGNTRSCDDVPPSAAKDAWPTHNARTAAGARKLAYS